MNNSFGKDIIPADDEARLKALQPYKLLKGLPESYFNNFARIIATTFDTPIALVSFVDKEEVLFPGNFGMEGTMSTPRGISLCSLAVLEESPTVFHDGLKEPCLLSNPLVAGEFGLRFYAGAPIVTTEGYAIGTVCIVDKEPREFGKQEVDLLKEFAQTAMRELEIRHELVKTVANSGRIL